MSSQEIPQTTTTFKEIRKFEITITSADNLPNVRRLGQMKVYAEVSLDGLSETTKKTQVEREGKTNPSWNFSVEYLILESAVQQSGVNLFVKLFCKRSLGDRFIGEVKIPVTSLFNMGLEARDIVRYTVDVEGSEGTPNGTLNISYTFGEKTLVPVQAQAQAPGPEPSGRKKALAMFVVKGIVVVLLTGVPSGWL